MRRLLLTVLVLVLAAAPALGQVPRPRPAAQGGPVTPGVLTVALNMPSDGFQVGAVSGTRVILARGLEVDLARAIGRRLGLRVSFRQVPTFTGLLRAPDGRWDMALGQISITSDRARRLRFSGAYMRAEQGVLMSRGVGRVDTIAALRSLRICTLRGSTSAVVVRRRVQPAQAPAILPTVTRLEQDLRSGRCQAGVLDAPILATLVARAPRSFGALTGVIRTGERYGATLPADGRLGSRIDAAVAALVADGTVARLERRWLAGSIAALPVLT